MTVHRKSFLNYGYTQTVFNKDTYLFTQKQSLLLEDAKSQLEKAGLYGKQPQTAGVQSSFHLQETQLRLWAAPAAEGE